jgi:hypothetical protein
VKSLATFPKDFGALLCCKVTAGFSANGFGTMMVWLTGGNSLSDVGHLS